MLCFSPTSAPPLCSIFHKNSVRTNPQDHPLNGCIEEEFDFFIQSTFINCSLSVLYNLFFFSDFISAPSEKKIQGRLHLNDMINALCICLTKILEKCGIMNKSLIRPIGHRSCLF